MDINQKVILHCLIRSNKVSHTLKIMVLTYLFFQLCWDFDYYNLCYDIETGHYKYGTYDFDNIQNPVGDKRRRVSNDFKYFKVTFYDTKIKNNRSIL